MQIDWLKVENCMTLMHAMLQIVTRDAIVAALCCPSGDRFYSGLIWSHKIFKHETKSAWTRCENRKLRVMLHVSHVAPCILVCVVGKFFFLLRK